MKDIVELLYNQTVDNPPVFVSHGSDHAVRTMDWCNKIANLTEVKQGMQQAYRRSEGSIHRYSV